MRWVKDGPDIPFELVQAAQEGQLVFFCGAGVSQEAGLPGFKGLVDTVYKKLHRQRALYPMEQRAFDEGNFDQVLANLERELKNPRLVREKVAETLQLPTDADTRTHEALLKLASDSHGMYRLVTTNYDLGFARYKKSSIRMDAAPRLPVPKPGRWNSIVHLHGFLEDCGPNMEELVLSSADFGTAYLVDGWATRFLRELFQHFTVLFVGYRAEDLVVRYMLQALAVSLADRGVKPKAFAFAEIEGNEKSTTASWEARGIRPILYSKKTNSHDVLHDTLRVWADKASRGLLGRKSVITEYLGRPAPMERDEVVDQVLWALRDENGATAKFLADQQVSPSPRNWLTVLDQGSLFSLNDVPLVDGDHSPVRSDVLHPVTLNLARWICKHLSETDVLDWVLSKGGCLNLGFRWLVRQMLNESTIAMPEVTKRAWTFLARPNNAIASRGGLERYALGKQIASGVWHLGLQYEVAVMLEPLFVLKRDVLKDIIREVAPFESDSYPLQVEVTLAGGDDLEYTLVSIRTRPDSDSILASLLDDCTTCLRRTMEVQHYFEQISADEDWTYITLKSISPFPSHSHMPWITLVDLAAECLEAAARTKPLLARSQVDYWKTIDYPVFRRLICYALACPKLFTAEEALAYIFACDLAMWHYACHVELCRLLELLWPTLDEESSRTLIARLLDGVPIAFYNGLSAEEMAELSNSAVAERLGALERSGRPLTQEAQDFRSKFKLKYVPMEVEPSEQDKSSIAVESENFAQAISEGIGSTLSLHNQWRHIVSTDWPTRSVTA
jgi:hypothetical protein